MSSSQPASSRDNAARASTAARPPRGPSLRGAILLSRARLAATGFGRAGAWLAWLLGGVFVIAAIAVRKDAGGEGSIDGLIASEGRALLWLAALPLALAAAGDLRGGDRRDGIETLIAARGLSQRGLLTARVVAAMAQTALVVAAPLAGVAFVSAALASSASAAFERLGVALAVVVFSIVAGVTLGGIGAACGRFARRRGPSLLLAIVIVPWLLADAFGRGRYSLPGAIDSVLHFTLGMDTSARIGGLW